VSLKECLREAEKATSVNPCLAAAAWYRLAARNLLAVAHATGRVAILPRIVCLCDRYWVGIAAYCSPPHPTQ
jgi:hypothetical protein